MQNIYNCIRIYNISKKKNEREETTKQTVKIDYNQLTSGIDFNSREFFLDLCFFAPFLFIRLLTFLTFTFPFDCIASLFEFVYSNFFFFGIGGCSKSPPSSYSIVGRITS